MGKVVPLNAQRRAPAALTVAQAVESFLERDWSENTRRNFASDLKRFREAVGRRRVDRLKPEDLHAYLGVTPSQVAPAMSIGRGAQP